MATMVAAVGVARVAVGVATGVVVAEAGLGRMGARLIWDQ